MTEKAASRLMEIGAKIPIAKPQLKVRLIKVGAAVGTKEARGGGAEHIITYIRTKK